MQSRWTSNWYDMHTQKAKRGYNVPLLEHKTSIFAMPLYTMINTYILILNTRTLVDMHVMHRMKIGMGVSLLFWIGRLTFYTCSLVIRAVACMHNEVTDFAYNFDTSSMWNNFGIFVFAYVLTCSAEHSGIFESFGIAWEVECKTIRCKEVII